jgi:hypothetical protein
LWYLQLLKKAEDQLKKVLLGLNFPKFEELMRQRLDPSKPQDAFIDNHNNRDVGYLFLREEKNGLNGFEGTLLYEIIRDEKLNSRFHVYDSVGNLYSCTGTS